MVQLRDREPHAMEHQQEKVLGAEAVHESVSRWCPLHGHLAVGNILKVQSGCGYVCGIDGYR